ncbi:MAG: CBS domain-containing protein [Myxococcota bacterium]|jgi:CBS domain-containing protein|nr:CBS domain-containing protein [Myxococcota bacterium]
MTAPVATCHPNDSLDHAAHLMWEHDCGAIPVVGADGALVGIVTDRDIAMAAYTRGQPLGSISVTTAMAEVVFSVDAEASLEEVEELMRAKQVRRVPVIEDGGKPIGMISVNDLARHIGDGKRPSSADRKLVETIARICSPRGRAATKREVPEARVDA